MGVEGLDPGAAQAGTQLRVQVARQGHVVRRPRALERLRDEPLVGRAGLEQRVPGLDLAGDGHGLPWYGHCHDVAAR